MSGKIEYINYEDTYMGFYTAYGMHLGRIYQILKTDYGIYAKVADATTGKILWRFRNYRYKTLEKPIEECKALSEFIDYVLHNKI